MTQLLDQSGVRPLRPTEPQIGDLRRRCAALTDQDLTSPEAFHRWSVEHFRDFWSTFLDWAAVAWEGSAEVVCTSDDVESATFFPDVRLNYAENLLRPLPGAGDDAPALTCVHGNGRVERLTRGQLRARVQRTATALAAEGIGSGDRVVVVAASNTHAVVTVLAAAALGAAVSTAMPDMGRTALLGRLGQVRPAALVLDRGTFPGWTGAEGDTLHGVVTGLPGIRRVLVVDGGPLPTLPGVPVAALDTDSEQLDGAQAEWPRLPFDHPLFVMFTSGTSGPPKAMVHGIGGTLLEHLKEHRVHLDLAPGDTYHHHSTTAWMVFNRQLSGLASGAHLVLGDGPVSGPESLWRLVAEHGVTVFGTSPAYLQLGQDAGYRPAEDVDLSRLRVVLASGAVLHDWQFDWFAEAVGPQPLQSISGGTDIIGAFVLGHPELPVPRGRFQTRGLGMDVAAVDEEGAELVGAVGELVCRNPFPSRPVAFLDDPDGARYHAAYFSQHPGMWTHGDLIEVARDGSSVISGRSDGVINVNGIRIGPAEIYTALRGVPEVAGAMAVEQPDPVQHGSSRLVLLVVPRDGAVVDDAVVQRIRATLRREASPAHVPSLVLPVAELPVTHNGKPSESAARDALGGVPPRNAAALRNPGSLAAITAAAQAAADRAATAAADAPEGADLRAVVSRNVADVLGTPVADDVDFFDAGGTSRQAMLLLRRMRLALGNDLPVADFLAEPTVAGLTAALRTATAGPGGVRLLTPGDASAVPLYLMHGAYGDLDDYRNLVEFLDAPGSVYGVVGPLQRPDGSMHSIGELAARYADVLVEHRPDGAFAVAGHSFGGLLAYEVARELTARGRAVPFLGMTDVRPPHASLTTLERTLTRGARLVATALPGYENVTLAQVLRARLRPRGNARYEESLFGRARASYARHHWGGYAGPVTFFRAAKRIPVFTNLMFAWRRVAPDMTVIDSPGMHYDMLTRENAAVLAPRFSSALRRSMTS